MCHEEYLTSEDVIVQVATMTSDGWAQNQKRFPKFSAQQKLDMTMFRGLSQSLDCILNHITCGGSLFSFEFTQNINAHSRDSPRVFLRMLKSLPLLTLLF